MEQQWFLSNPNNISFSWYTDGIPVYKSSHISLWPFYLTINELPFNERKKRENTLLLGYWFDDKKPYMNNFIYRFREELHSITEGVQIYLPDNNVIVVRGVVLMGVCDQPAKSDCFNFMLYNADFGCTSCLSKGQSLRTDAGGTVHVYPHEPQVQLRTSQQTVTHGNLATPDEPVMGVKGNSALCLIMPDFIRGTAIDRMHCSDGGVIKKILSLLFDATYSDNVFSLRGVINQIDNRLIGIRPPKFIHRLPRTITDLKHWKASELKVFCFYYAIPLFEGIMQLDYFQNFVKLIIGLYILSCDIVTDEMIAVARDFLNSFVREFQQLYGLRYCSINIHLLVHLPDSVKNLGPLWAHTCYESEDLNGQILKLFHSTWHIDTQLARSQSQVLTMIRLIDLSRNEKVKDFCYNKKNQVKIVDQISDHCYTVGNYKYLEHDDIPLIIVLAMHQSGLLINNV
ncbi:uncharacterized protein LOC123265424 isoform X1 [Cotesia glomerata]|uniref:uncharacterized protein LOC123265424 isoform X1 n=1 Tax=Cotesia glomerata TaxID=32391 RepID=UPI001D01EC6F|nr:uncharacterized protein LOC123265424 isoform X1 [Cotesia glomerata]XP_044585099.1 uncharacterized protein LOC123265424 isoform X1 [Cotesia glomerata]